jgi:hypothetical protein
MLNQRRTKATRGRAAGPTMPDARPPDEPVVMASLEEVLDALEGVDLDRPWAAIRHQVIPVLPRWRPFPGPADTPVTRTWPPGLEARFGLDIGPAFLYIGSWALEHWAITADELADQAIANVHERVAARRHHPLLTDSVGGLPMTAYQSRDGWASTLLLVPELLVRIFGPEPALVLAPMRDLVIQVPVDADPDLAAWLMEEFSSMDPNGLAVPVLALVDGRLSLAPVRSGVKGPGRRRH